MSTQEISCTQPVDDYVVVGVVQGHFGVKGWIKVLSYTRPPLDILQFHHWSIVRPEKRANGGGKRRQSVPDRVSHCDETLVLAEGRWHGKGLIARIETIDSREAAERLVGATVVVRQDQFAQLDEYEFYWTDLVGLKVRNQQGADFGSVDHLVETGANDVLVIHRMSEDGQVLETLIPWADQFVLKVDLEQGEMLVDWDAD